MVVFMISKRFSDSSGAEKCSLVSASGGLAVNQVPDKAEMILKFGEKTAAIKNAEGRAAVVSPKDYETREAFNQALLEKIQSYQVDLVVLAGCLVVIPKIMVDAYPNRIINIHPSLIPSFCGTGYYGLKVHEAALERGVKVTGATVHFVDDGTDTGPIILQKAVEIKDGDTPEVLQRRVMEEAEWVIMPKAIDLIANGKVKVVDHRTVISE